MPSRFQVYISESHNPYYNLALETRLTQTAMPDAYSLFLWCNQPCVVLGRHQNPYSECHLGLMRVRGIPIVRRPSGGGTVYHDLGNLNFSFIAPEQLMDEDRNLEIVCSALESLGIAATINERRDILVAGKKISGSAYYTKENKRKCHHGTLLVDANLEDLAGLLYERDTSINVISNGVESVRSSVANLASIRQEIQMKQVTKALIESFSTAMCSDGCKAIGAMTVLQEMNQEACDDPLMRDLLSHYQSWEWVFGKTPKFRLNQSRIFDWGQADFSAQVHSGVFADAILTLKGFDASSSPRTNGMAVEHWCIEIPLADLVGLTATQDRVEGVLTELHLEAPIKTALIDWLQSLFY